MGLGCSASTLLTFGAGWILVLGFAPSIVAGLASSWTSTFQMSDAFTNLLWPCQMFLVKSRTLLSWPNVTHFSDPLVLNNAGKYADANKRSKVFFECVRVKITLNNTNSHLSLPGSRPARSWASLFVWLEIMNSILGKYAFFYFTANIYRAYIASSSQNNRQEWCKSYIFQVYKDYSKTQPLCLAVCVQGVPAYILTLLQRFLYALSHLPKCWFQFLNLPSGACKTEPIKPLCLAQHQNWPCSTEVCRRSISHHPKLCS